MAERLQVKPCMHEAEYRGRYKTVGDNEHGGIIRLYIEEGLSVEHIAERLQRSSRTPYQHIRKHNKAVEHTGVCQICGRVKSEFEKKIAVRG